VETRYRVQTSSKKIAKKFSLKVGKSYPVTQIVQEWGYKYYYVLNEKKENACICPLTWKNQVSITTTTTDGELSIEKVG